MATSNQSNEGRMIKDKTTIKDEYKPGGKNRQVILDKAVKFLTAKYQYRKAIDIIFF